MTLCLVVSVGTEVAGAERTITMGFVAPYSGRAGYTLTAPGATVAIQRAKSEGLLNDIDIRYDGPRTRHDAQLLDMRVEKIAERYQSIRRRTLCMKHSPSSLQRIDLGLHREFRRHLRLYLLK